MGLAIKQGKRLRPPMKNTLILWLELPNKVFYCYYCHTCVIIIITIIIIAIIIVFVVVVVVVVVSLRNTHFVHKQLGIIEI